MTCSSSTPCQKRVPISGHDLRLPAANVGFNAYGIAQLCDSVYPNDPRIGIPRVVAARAVLASQRLDKAIQYSLSPQRAAGYNHVLAHESGELYSVEVSAHHFPSCMEGRVYGAHQQLPGAGHAEGRAQTGGSDWLARALFPRPAPG